MKKGPVKVSVGSHSVSTPRPILFLALDDVLCHGIRYGLAEALEIMRQHKRVTDRGLSRRSPYSWDTPFEVSSFCRLENLHKEFSPRYVLSSNWTRFLDRDAMYRLPWNGGVHYVADNLHLDWETIKLRQGTRAQEISSWLQVHQTYSQSWAVLNSTASGTGLNDDCPYTVLCQPVVGFTMADQTKLRQAFQRRLTAVKDGGQSPCCVPITPIGCLAQPESPPHRLPKDPRVKGGQVLYLDFDGVLHHEDVCVNTKRGLYFGANAQAHGVRHGHSHRLFEFAPLLIDLLEPYPDVQIVLSTSWVRWRGYEHARDRLPTALARRCVGATFHKQMGRNAFLQIPRGLQIWMDVERRQPSVWLAIDDDHSDWPDWCQDRLVRSDDNWGISRPKVRSALKAALAKTFGRT